MKNFLTLFTLFLTWQCLAQKVTISDPFSVRTDDKYEFIGKIKNQYLVFHDKGVEFEIKAFDKNMHSSWDKEIELEKRRTKVLGVVPGKDGFAVVYTHRKKRKLNVLVSRFTPSANLLDTATVKNFGNQLLTPNLQVIRSEDKKTILLYQIKEQKKIEATAFSLENMEVLWERTLQPEGMAYYETYEQMVLNNQGDLFVILKKDNRKNKKDEHHYEIHKITRENDYNFFSVHMQDRLTYDIDFSFDNKNDLLIAGGLYSDKNRGRANGYFFMSIPPEDPSSHKLIFENFNEELTSKLIGKKADSKKGVADVDIQEIVHRHDGGVLLIIERNRHLERGSGGTRVGYSGGRSFVDYYYDDVLVVSLHPDGQKHWEQVLHKKQYSQDDDAMFSSYFLLKTPSNLRFIFNDEIKLENTVSEYVLNGNGDYERNSVLSTDDQRIQLRFAHAMQVGSREFIVPSVMRSKMKLIRVKY